ncbi:PorP/SprF family type IX secretion system membrane protein [Flaviramulus sp. BrNp1-15]|uniref:PorP/SprF family type IX secretion system membrane protein n=1 Tax=Flaviramulus sp. BrNp1-15 TaxID=2916754 RepID=UPI001EE9243A|nr:PorP/SprF family type IX secretion system membrane protein [Flaviramulus sp. BrNp1-15]ULC58062.1 PorP/SprF family type IX secretion system membrane protein [Flaviramulus sp. BrNp1-15]
MKKHLIYVILFFITIQQFYSQEDGVVALNLPVRNSLKFNKYAINPVFSFVREQNKYISFTNKREWVQFDDAPQTYLFGYSGRFTENIGAGLSLFQQNYGVLTTFGGVLNFAYNVVLDRDQNLTFGTNLGVYSSGINEGNVVTNFPDTSLDNIPSNTLITINPGINYGTDFFDFGLSINNLALYNFTTSSLIEENPEQSIQVHMMYTGYVNSRGFFDESKFSGLVRSEFKKEKTILSGVMMLTVPKGIWAQVGYNTLYGISGGLGLNITTQIALEYNYEKAMGNLSNFGNSHEITLAYKFKNRYRYNYSGDDDEQAFIIADKKPKRTVASRKPVRKPANDTSKVDIEAENKAKAEAEAQRLAEEARVKAEAEEQARIQAEEQARIEAENKAKAEAEAQRLAEEARVKAEAEEQARIQAEAQARIEAENKAKAEAEAQRLAEEAQARAEAEEQARIQAEAQARIEAENKAKAEAEAQRLAEEARVKAEAEEQARIQAEAQARAEAEEQARIQAEAQARIEAENKAKAEAEEKERLEAQQKIDTVELEGVLVPTASDREALALESLTKLTESSKIEQQDLLIRLRETVATKQQDLDDLKEENDLSEQGIYQAPKPFKSISAENAALASLKIEIDDIISSQEVKISQLENLYNERLKNVPNKNDEVNTYYLKAIQDLKSEQLQAIRVKENLVSRLDDIKVATEFERNRRIKRAAYDNEEVRYNKDRAALNTIKLNTAVSSVPLVEEDLDFGEERGNNIEIVKDIKNIENGYYLVLAVHSDASKRDEFLTQVVASGRSDIDFFFDVSTNKYYIYYQKFDDVGRARSAIESKGNEAYNSKISLVKIEN